MTKAKILVVEDEAIVALEIKLNLQNYGFEVIDIVDSCTKVLNTIEKEIPDLILMDIRIKGDLDGIDTAELVRKKYEIPIVFLTAYLDEERLERAKLTMPFGYILKPVQERDLRVTVDMAIYVAKADAERRRIEQELRESLQTSKDIIDYMPSGLFIYQYEEKDRLIMIEANPEAQRQTGIDKKEVLGKEFNEIWPAAKESGITDQIISPVKTGKPYETENVFYQDSNLTGAFRVRTFLMPNKRLGVAFDDITKRMQDEIEVKRSHDIFNNIQVGLHIYKLEDIDDDTSLRLISANKASEMIIGIPNESLIGKLIDENFPNLISKGIPQKYSKVIRDQKPITLEDVQYSDERVISSWFKVKAFPLPDQCVGVAFEDITPQKTAQNELEKSESFYQSIVDSIGDGFFILDNNLEIQFFSEKAERLLNLQQQDVVGKQIFDLFPTAKGTIFEEKYTEAVQNKVPLHFKTYVETSPYSNWYDIRVHPFEEGILVFMIVNPEGDQKLG